MIAKTGWIGVDFDGTISSWKQPGVRDGTPIAPMVARVVEWLSAGREVRILTARVAGEFSRDLDTRADATSNRRYIETWCREHLGKKLVVTSQKDQSMFQMWDDRAVTVISNTGECASTWVTP